MFTAVPIVGGNASGLGTNGVLLLAGIVILYLGAEVLVSGAAKLALGFGIHAAVVGVTVIAFATSAPELFVALLSGVDYSSDLGLGAIVGSNIANIGLVLGVTAVVRPMSVNKSVVTRHLPFMFAAAFLLITLGSDGFLSRVDGIILLLALAAFSGSLLYFGSREDDAMAEEVDVDEDADAELVDIGKVLLSLALLFVGSRLLIQGGQGVLSSFGFTDRFIGLSVLAFGTSMPELATSVVSAVRGEADFSVGNVIGSNIYNILAVLGLLTVMLPLGVSTSIIRFDFPMLFLFTMAVVAILLRGRDVTRLHGGFLIGSYLLFFYFLLA